MNILKYVKTIILLMNINSQSDLKYSLSWPQYVLKGSDRPNDPMKFLHTNTLNAQHKEELLQLWNEEYPLELSLENLVQLDAYLDGLEFQHHVLLLDENNQVQGWYSDFLRHNERWFLVILASQFQGKNWGGRLLEHGRQEREELNGWMITADSYKKMNGKTYRSPDDFYRKMGFSFIEDVLLNSETITAIKIKWNKPEKNTPPSPTS